ncbi:MAG TPA: hypothetical protein VKZ74_05075 [Natronosporangium sp.]|nr:hypothetical protein [Natronosporangium sp.]
MEWWVWVGLAVLLLTAYLTWLAARVGRLHRRAASAGAALDACLVRRAAAATLLADELSTTAPQAAAQVRAAARTALAATPAEREAAENDLTQVLRQLADGPARPAPGWPAVVTASRRVGLARQVHTDQVRDALAVRRRVLVRLLRLARRHPEPSYFDVGDPVLDDHADWTEPSRR